MIPSHLSNVDLQGQDGPPELDALSDPVRENCSVVSMGAESHRLCLVPAPGPPSRDVMHWGAPSLDLEEPHVQNLPPRFIFSREFAQPLSTPPQTLTQALSPQMPTLPPPV